MKKKGIILALAALACTFIGAATACNESTGTQYTGFLEGYTTKLEIGDTIMLERYIDVKDGEEYTLVAVHEDGSEVDLSGKSSWYVKDPGKWTLTLTITSGDRKGTYTAGINVTVPYATMTYNEKTIIYKYGSTVSKEQLLKDFRIRVNTKAEWTQHIYNVRIGDDVIVEFDDDMTGYTFTDFEPHYFTIGIVTDQGQISKGIITVNVQEADDAALYYCDENDIKVHSYQRLTYRDGSLSAQMAAGSFTDYFKNADLPYFAFEGEYGTDSYVSVDFTGKNIPQTAFFCDVVSESLYDKNTGIYISHGTVTMDGGERVAGDHSCLTYFGTQKMKEYHVNTGGSFGREGWPSAPHPASRVGLEDGVHYRYIVGYTNPVAGTANKSGERGSITLRMLLVNMDTGEIVVDMTKKLSGNEQTGVLEERHFKGSIVLYANYAVTTTWDNIELISENVADIYDLYPTVSFEDDALEYGIVNDVIKPTDFLSADVLAGGNLYYSYKAKQGDAEGELQAFTSDLTIDKAGAYRITFVPNDTKVNPRSMMLYANASLTLDFEDGVHNALQGEYRAGAYLETENVLSGEKSANVKVGSILGLNTSSWGVDMEYLDRVFADTSVENVVMKMKADADVYAPMTYQTGNSNGSPTYSASGTIFKKDELTFVTITRENYEAAKEGNTTGKYMFRFYASGSSISLFNISVDDVTVGKVHKDGVFAYKEGLDASYVFEGTVQEFYFNNRKFTPDQTDSGVTFDGNMVTISSALLADVAGQTVQYVAKTENGMEISNQTPINSIDTYIAYYADGDSRNTGNKVAFDVIGSVQSVKIGDEAVPFEQRSTTLYIKKIDLAKYAGAEAKTLSVVTKLADDSETTIEMSFQGTLMQIPTFETEGELLPFTTENMGEAVLVDNGTEGLDNVNVGTAATGSSYKITLPDIGTGLHKITIPIGYLEEIFATPYVDVYRFYVALSYKADGVYLSDGMGTERIYKTFQVRAINRDNFNTLKATGKDYVLTLDASTHAGSVEYMYLDNFHVLGSWFTSYADYTQAEVDAYGITLDGFYGNVTSIVNNQKTDEDWTADFDLNGNSISIKEEKLADYNGRRLLVKTDKGVSYIIEIRVKA